MAYKEYFVHTLHTDIAHSCDTEDNLRETRSQGNPLFIMRRKGLRHKYSLSIATQTVFSCIELVETEGVEPSSENIAVQTSTSLAYFQMCPSCELNKQMHKK